VDAISTKVSTSLLSGSVLATPEHQIVPQPTPRGHLFPMPGGVHDHAPPVPWLRHLVKCIVKRYPISQALGWGHLSESKDPPIELTLSFAAGNPIDTTNLSCLMAGAS